MFIEWQEILMCNVFITSNQKFETNKIFFDMKQKLVPEEKQLVFDTEQNVFDTEQNVFDPKQTVFKAKQAVFGAKQKFRAPPALFLFHAKQRRREDETAVGFRHAL
jgi:hypothetical protein